MNPITQLIGGAVCVLVYGVYTFFSMYGPRTGLSRTSTCLLRAKYRLKPVSESCASSIFSHGYTAPVRVQNSSKIARARTGFLDSIVRTGPVNCPGASCDCSTMAASIQLRAYSDTAKCYSKLSYRY